MKIATLSIILILVFAGFCSQGSETTKGYEKKTFVYKTVGQDSIRSDFYKIADDTSMCPVIVWIHGGAFIWGSRNSLPEEQLECYLHAGYAVLSIDYRLAPETKLLEITGDIKDAITWVQSNSAQLEIDPRRIFVIGHSAGGYLALMTGYILDKPPRAIVSFYGYGEIESAWCNQPDSFYLGYGTVPKEKALASIRNSVVTSASSHDRSDLYVYSRQQGIWTNIISGHNPAKEPGYFDRLCPIKNIKNGFPPVLLIHGDRDTDVPIEQSVKMDEALGQNNIDHQFITMRGMGHAFDKLDGGLRNKQISGTVHEVIRFLDKYK